MFEPTCEIFIGKYVFRYAHQVVIKSGRDLLSATAIIKLANVQTFVGDPYILDQAITVGDEVEIRLGYDGNNKVEFVGYVAEKRPNTPYEIHCEDQMWQLKRKTVTKYYSSISLQGLIEELVPGVKTFGIYQAVLTGYRLNKATVAQVLAEIKNTYGLDVYCRGKQVYVGLAYNEAGGVRIKYNLQDTTIKNNLVFLQPGDLKIRVRAISLLTDNTFIEVETGDSEGDTTTLTFTRLTQDELLKQANEKVKALKVKGYKGTVLSWGVPYAKHGDIAQWLDDFYPNRQQSNFIDQVTVEWGINGFRRTIVPGLKAP